MAGTLAVTLPETVEHERPQARVAELRPLTAAEHLFFVEDCADMLPARWASEVLARCVTRIGDASPGLDGVRKLAVGDRDLLLLQVHALQFGDAIRCVARCPGEGCGQSLDLELSSRELRVSPPAPRGVVHELLLQGQDPIRLRVPNGADHEAAAELARGDLPAGVALLLRRCVDAGEGVDPCREDLAPQISARLSELDPQAEIMLDASCPDCAMSFRARFDIASFLRRELAQSTDELYHEIHLLAFHYHWSAADILAMTAASRRRYLRLLERELALRGGA